jgi:hypothetical protein
MREEVKDTWRNGECMGPLDGPRSDGGKSGEAAGHAEGGGGLQ